MHITPATLNFTDILGGGATKLENDSSKTFFVNYHIGIKMRPTEKRVSIEPHERTWFNAPLKEDNSKYKSHRRVFEFNKKTDLDAFNSVPWKEIDVELVQNRENPE